MQNFVNTIRCTLGVVFVAVASVAATGEAPSAERVTPAISHYHRIAPYAATAGLLGAGGLEEARRLGFARVIDLRTAAEGAASEQRAARRLGIPYLNIPVATRAPTPAQVAAFAQAVEDPVNRPVLVHCHTANRAGAMWALYLASKGDSLERAIAAGRAAGLAPNREPAVRTLIARAPNGDVTSLVSSPAAAGNTPEDTVAPAPGAGADENPFDLNAGQDMGC